MGSRLDLDSRWPELAKLAVSTKNVTMIPFHKAGLKKGPYIRNSSVTCILAYSLLRIFSESHLLSHLFASFQNLWIPLLRFPNLRRRRRQRCGCWSRRFRGRGSQRGGVLGDPEGLRIRFGIVCF